MVELSTLLLIVILLGWTLQSFPKNTTLKKFHPSLVLFLVTAVEGTIHMLKETALILTICLI